MINTIINKELNICYPEDFNVLNEEELMEVYMNKDTNRWAARNTDRHVMIAVLWESSGLLQKAFADLKAVARKNEQLMSKGLRAYEYKCNGFISEEVCGQTAHGYCYEYVNKGISQHARTLLFRTRANIYGITCYTRGPMNEETAALFSEVLASIHKA